MATMVVPAPGTGKRLAMRRAGGGPPRSVQRSAATSHRVAVAPGAAIRSVRVLLSCNICGLKHVGATTYAEATQKARKIT
jgi:hypothetical protein